MTTADPPGAHAVPLLLYNGECAVCRAIAGWVARSSQRDPRGLRIAEQPIGDDPAALLALNPDLDIWDAYATVHVLMPDGSMKLGGGAVAEVLRDLPPTRWFSGIFALGIGGFRPAQGALDAGYAILSGIRPVLGCASCGSTNAVVRAAAHVVTWLRDPKGHAGHPKPMRHASAHRAARSDLRTSADQ